MELSKHNIIGPIAHSKDYFIVNPLSQEADILDEKSYNEILQGTYKPREDLIAKGYLVDTQVEAKVFKEKYFQFLEDRDKEEVQVFFVPSYQCNFQCSYCYQSGYDPKRSDLKTEVVDAFFRYLDQSLAGRKKYITLFGGEPLLPSEIHKNNILLILEEAMKRQLDVAVVSNGYSLKEYLPLLKKYSIREIQITLDGLEEVHNQRRPLLGHQGSFHPIVEGIDLALEAGIPINLRMVIDRENLEELPKLAQFAVDRAWTSNPLFKTQLGRNYELHYCQSHQSKLFSRIEMYRQLYGLIEKHPQILEFHRPAFSVSRFLWEKGELPNPLFDSCPGCKSEWAMDYTGKIYSCTATVGKEEEALGSFYPQVTMDEDKLENWQDRDITEIQACQQCSLQLACGGGCASVANNKNGELCSPDCRPVEELLSLGISAYFEKAWLGESE